MTGDVDKLRRDVAAVARTGGGTVTLAPGEYNLGNDGIVLPPRITIEGPGATIIRASRPKSVESAFWCDDPQQVVIRGLSFRDPAQDLRDNKRGLIAITAWGKSPARCGGVTLDNVTGDGVMSLLRVGGPGGRVSGIRVSNCKVTNSYYAVECQGNGDDVVVTGLTCHNVIRPLILYGVSYHDHYLWISGDGKVPLQKTLCLVKCYGPATTNIRIRAWISGKQPGVEQVVGVEFEGPPTMVGRIADVFADVRFGAGLYHVKPLAFSSLIPRPDGKYDYEPTLAGRTVERVTGIGSW